MISVTRHEMDDTVDAVLGMGIRAFLVVGRGL